jgi:hypothetical protein
VEADDRREGTSIAMDIRRALTAVFQTTTFDVHIVPAGWLVKSSSGKMARRATRAKWDSRASATRPPD